MEPSGEWRSEIRSILDEELAASTELLTVLKSEREALHARDLPALAASGERKGQCLTSLEGIEADRVTMLRLAGLPGAGDADESVFERLGPKDELRMRWQRIQGVVEECQHLNEANGRLVALQRRQVEQALQALNGGGNADVYGPDGARDQLGVNRLTTSA